MSGFVGKGWALRIGDCVEVMNAMPEACIDAIVTDAPYGLEFMGKEWDKLGDKSHGHAAVDRSGLGVPRFGSYAPFASEKAVEKLLEHRNAMQAWHLEWCKAALRVLKPGGHLLAFGGTRTYHRLACAVEDAGFEIRDQIDWFYGSGFPKSLDVSKAIDKASGAEREVVGYDASRARPNRNYDGGALGNIGGTGKPSDRTDNGATLTAPATDAAKKFSGWGTALKPAHEPIVVARKPLIGTVAANVLAHGTGALNIDGCRIGQPDDKRAAVTRSYKPGTMAGGKDSDPLQAAPHDGKGRWPANVVLSHDERCVEVGVGGGVYGDASMPLYACVPGCPVRMLDGQTGDSGGASRFFYVAKPARSERDRGLSSGANNHPTVKPVEVMRYLIRLVTPVGGIVLDPFVGSGTTGIAALEEGAQFVGIEKEAAYATDIAQHRIRSAEAA